MPSKSQPYSEPSWDEADLAVSLLCGVTDKAKFKKLAASMQAIRVKYESVTMENAVFNRYCYSPALVTGLELRKIEVIDLACIAESESSVDMPRGAAFEGVYNWSKQATANLDLFKTFGFVVKELDDTYTIVPRRGLPTEKWMGMDTTGKLLAVAPLYIDSPNDLDLKPLAVSPRWCRKLGTYSAKESPSTVRYTHPALAFQNLCAIHEALVCCGTITYETTVMDVGLPAWKITDATAVLNTDEEARCLKTEMLTEELANELAAPCTLR